MRLQAFGVVRGGRVKTPQTVGGNGEEMKLVRVSNWIGCLLDLRRAREV